MTNIRVDKKMDASEFEGSLYKILSEEPFKNKRNNIRDKDDEITSF